MKQRISEDVEIIVSPDEFFNDKEFHSYFAALIVKSEYRILLDLEESKGILAILQYGLIDYLKTQDKDSSNVSESGK